MANQLKYVFRLTHIDNIQHVLSNGLVRASSPLRSDNYLPIGDSQVIKIRGNREVDGYRLSEYVPFYFGPRSPMLYNMDIMVCAKKNRRILYTVLFE